MLVYFIIISIFTGIITCYDKLAARYLTKYRIREDFLILLAILGGGLIEYLTMQIIRHKTRKPKFMISLPIIIIIQLIILIYYQINYG